jgi:hypothetical protein
MSHTPQKDEKASAVDRFVNSQDKPPAATKDEIPDENPFYRREKEARGPALAMTLVLRNGNRKTIPYHLLIEMDFNDPDVGIEIYYSTGVKITIRGNHLQKLYDEIAEQRILQVRSMDKLHAQSESQICEVSGQPLPMVEEISISRGTIDPESGVWKPASGSWNARNQQWQPSTMMN